MARRTGRCHPEGGARRWPRSRNALGRAVAASVHLYTMLGQHGQDGHRPLSRSAMAKRQPKTWRRLRCVRRPALGDAGPGWLRRAGATRQTRRGPDASCPSRLSLRERSRRAVWPRPLASCGLAIDGVGALAQTITSSKTRRSGDQSAVAQWCPCRRGARRCSPTGSRSDRCPRSAADSRGPPSNRCITAPAMWRSRRCNRWPRESPSMTVICGAGCPEGQRRAGLDAVPARRRIHLARTRSASTKYVSRRPQTARLATTRGAAHPWLMLMNSARRRCMLKTFMGIS